MLIDSLESSFANARQKGWDRIYLAIDIHDTIVRGNYRTDELPTDFFPLAKETLQMLSERDDVVLILFTCSWPTEIAKYLQFFEYNGIRFRYVNENPEVPDNALGYYRQKFYFNLILDDKAAFNANDEWKIVWTFFKNNKL
jgi:hypothetical protein